LKRFLSRRRAPAVLGRPYNKESFSEAGRGRAVQKRVTVGFGLVLAVVVLNTLLSFGNARRLLTSERQVVRTREVLAALEEFLSLLQDAETGQRGFLLTGDESYLAPYREATAEVDGVPRVRRQLGRLRDLAGAEPARAEALDKLAEETDRKLAELAETVRLRRQPGGEEEALAVVRAGRGKRAMDAIREAAATWTAAEEDRLRARSQQAEKAAGGLRLMLAVGGVLSVCLIGLAYALSRRDADLVRRAADLVRQEREWFEVTLLGIGDGVIATDSRGRVILLNPVAQELTGWSQNEAAGRPVEEVFRIVNEQTRRPVESPVARVIREGVIQGLANHTTLLARDGSERPIDDSGGPIRGTAGTVLGAVLVFRDISARRQREEALREAGRRRDEALAQLDSLLANAPVGFAFYDRELRYVRINDFLAALNGVPAAAHLGRCIHEIVPAVAATVQPVLEEVFRTDRAVTGLEVTGETPAAPGLRRTWLAAFYPVPVGPDKPRWVGGVVLEITERKKLEAELVEADRRKDEFLAMLGHELRNPLAAIRNALEVARLPGAGEAAAGQMAAIVERQVGNLVRLVDDLLDISRISRGKIELRRQSVDLAAVVGRAVEAARPFLDERQHDLEVVPPAGPLRLEGDPVRLEQVFANLLNNAVKYTPPGGRIRVAVGREGDAAVVRVADTGIGIRPEMLPRIFDVFQQADRVAGRVSEGLGLGLTLVRRFTELHGGTVEARSPGPGQGSQFIVRLPLAAGEPGAAPPAPAEETPAVRPLKVLIIDDNTDGAESLAVLLRLDGSHEVRVAGDGPSGLETARDFRPQVVLLDIGLPRGMDGYEVARRLREVPGTGPALLVALTGYGGEEDRRRTEAAGFDAHCVKPADLAVLRRLFGRVAAPGPLPPP
jgi:PAS domain S-box-containing protein